MNKFLHWFARPIYGISKMGRNIGSVMLGLMVVLIAIEVIFRYVFTSPIKGVTDIVELLMIFFVFLTVAEVAMDKEHINVKLVFSRFSPRVQTIMSGFVSFISFLIFTLISWQLIVRSLEQFARQSMVTATLQITIAPFLLVAAFGCLLLAVVLLIDSIKYFYALRAGNLER